MVITITDRERIKSWASEKFKRDDKALDSFDINSEIDSSLSVEENKGILEKKIKNLLSFNSQKLTRKQAEIMPKEQHTQLIIQELKRVEKQAELEFEISLDKIEKLKTTNILEEMYFIPKQLCKALIKGHTKGLMIIGERGIGKSHNIMRTFREMNTKFVYHTGHITSLELYNFLYENRKEHIIFDDVNLLENDNNIGLLKSCLGEMSICCYKTTSSKLRCPDKFKFEGTITILLNTKPESEDLKAVESRVLTYEMNMNYENKIKTLFELAKIEYKDLSLEDRFMIARWIKDNTSKATESLSLRFLYQLYEFYRFDNLNWIELGKSLIKTDERKQLIIQGIGQKEFCENTGLSRATYFRFKKELSIL